MIGFSRTLRFQITFFTKLREDKLSIRSEAPPQNCRCPSDNCLAPAIPITTITGKQKPWCCFHIRPLFATISFTGAYTEKSYAPSFYAFNACAQWLWEAPSAFHTARRSGLVKSSAKTTGTKQNMEATRSAIMVI